MEPLVLQILDKRIDKVETEMRTVNGVLNQHVYSIILDTLKDVRAEYVRETNSSN